MLICYDAEFPLLGRVLAEAGVEIILSRHARTRSRAITACGSGRHGTGAGKPMRGGAVAHGG